MVYNFSRDSEYHTQINNKVISAETCNTTSMIMAHRQAEHKPIFAMDGEQPEDCLTSFLLKHPESRERMKYMYPWFVERNIPAYEVHEMLLYARESIKFEYEKLREQKNQSLDKGYKEIDQLEKLIDDYKNNSMEMDELLQGMEREITIIRERS
jgi:hypothetical protein